MRILSRLSLSLLFTLFLPLIAFVQSTAPQHIWRITGAPGIESAKEFDGEMLLTHQSV
jgi:hypothetical protein